MNLNEFAKRNTGREKELGLIAQYFDILVLLMTRLWSCDALYLE
jgi:hypothetical protein